MQEHIQIIESAAWLIKKILFDRSQGFILGGMAILCHKPNLCTGSEMCTIVCPHGVFGMNGRKAEIVRYEACLEGEACRMNGPFDAITVDSGVGCAFALMKAALTGKKESCS
jgi:NAD-dependent dihydropyrimidine dehydrogenase PreA subunit